MCSIKERSLNQLLAEPTVNGKHDLSKWKYSQLRDIINTSCDIQLLEVRYLYFCKIRVMIALIDFQNDMFRLVKQNFIVD